MWIKCELDVFIFTVSHKRTCNENNSFHNKNKDVL